MLTGRSQSLVHETMVIGFPSPGNGGPGGVPQEKLLTTDMLYTNFSTYFVVKFISLAVAFKVFLERKIWLLQHF